MRLSRFAPLVAAVTLGTALPAASAQPSQPADLHTLKATGAAAAAPAGRGPETPAAASADRARDVREELERTLEQYPPSLARVLKLDPTLLSNADYLKPYPALTAFLAQHPEVVHNPSYYFERYQAGGYIPDPAERAVAIWQDIMQGVAIGLFMLALAGGLLWLIKMLIDHRRWTRLSRIQTDVHNKLLDRFTSNEDLLAYIQTPAGRRFLESAPIPLEMPRALSAPLGRILWSAQAGAVLLVAGLGLEVVAMRAIEEIAQPLSALGVVVIALGIGFLVSAGLAYVLSRRLGLLGPEPPTVETRG